MATAVGGVLQSLERKEIQKEGLSEYFLYTIEGTETIPNQWGKRLLSFEADDIPVTSLYKYDEERWGTETIRFLSFANDEKHKLGQTPIPDGAVRIYGQAGEQGHLSYVGAMNVKYIPVNEEVELNLGPARLVEVKPILMDYKVENHTFDNQRQRLRLGRSTDLEDRDRQYPPAAGGYRSDSRLRDAVLDAEAGGCRRIL